MNIRRFATVTTMALTLVAALTMQSAGASNPNLIGDGSFESPAVMAGGFGDFPTGSTLGTCGLAAPGSPGYQVNCWRVFGGTVDVAAAPYWAGKGSKQSIELNGTGPGDILQMIGVAPNTTYHFSFYMSGDPFIAGVVKLLAVQEQFDGGGNYITGGPLGTFSFDTTGHTTTSMGYKLVTTSFTTGPNAHYADVELQSLTVNNNALWWGPVVDGAAVHL
jgi:hypothetical protein